MGQVIGFWSENKKYGEFSNWYKCSICYNNLNFISSEQLFMYQKAFLFKDMETAELILQANDQKTIKNLGRLVKNFDGGIWDIHKYKIMLEANMLKFTQNQDLKEKLLETEDALIVEASPYDKIWGIGMFQNQEGWDNPDCWKGLNLLGQVLMEVREKLREH